MNRRTFALRWGRKLFFGISWPLSTILTLLYFQSFILPEDKTDIFYLIFTLIGHMGILNTVFYFFFYSPVALLLPTYYISRIWSLILITSLNLFILLDALSFSQYHHHVYGMISKLIIEQGIHNLIGSEIGLWVLGGVAFFITLIIWIRGENIWRHMQGRFNNPVSHWYLFLIFGSFAISKLIYHYGDIHPKLADIFPFNYHLSRIEKDYHDNRKFYYPSGNLLCQGKQNPNFVFIIVEEWGNEQFNLQSMPKTFHMKNHAISFNSNFGVATDIEGGMYSLLYSLPSSYKRSTGNQKPAIYKELSSRKYEIVNLEEKLNAVNSVEGNITYQLKSWAENHIGTESRPYFISIVLKQSSSKVDMEIQKIVAQLQKDDLLNNTHILITGAYAGAQSKKIPFLWMRPDKTTQEINKITSQYDIMPTLMEKVWGCKKAFSMASVGAPVGEKEWLLITGKNEFKVIDFKTDTITSVIDGKVLDSGKNPRHDLIFKALKMMTKFNKPH